MSEVKVAVIGGSGLYDMPNLTDATEAGVETPFGSPSANITIGTLHGQRIAFLPRHGRGHVMSPSEVPYRANIYALKSLGVQYIISVSACGSLREEFAPGHVVVPDQLYDNTKGKREATFFERGLVAHISVANPFSPEFSRIVADSVRSAGGTVHEGGTFITIEGPRFSTKGESNLFRQWGMSIIGMTTSPEAFLAAEAEIAYAVMAHVSDYDVWHESEEPVTVEAVIRVLQRNTALAQNAISRVVKHFDEWAGSFPAHHALKSALITDPGKIPAELRAKLAPIVNKYIS